MTWTATLVEERLREAAATLRHLPADRPRGFRSAMPAPVRSAQEAYGWHETRVRPAPPSPGAVDRLDEVLGWMGWLDEDQIRVLWARANGVPWRPICRRLGCGRTKAWQTWVAALVVLKVRLNEIAIGANFPLNSVNKTSTHGNHDGAMRAGNGAKARPIADVTRVTSRRLSG